MNLDQPDLEYVLGTGDVELERLRLQHAVWRTDAAAAWQAAAFRPGNTIVDVGCGPGFASLDLAELVGPQGRVVAIDQSKRFLDHLAAQTMARGVENVTRVQADLSGFTFNGLQADGAWMRWILAFVRNPRAALERVVGTLAPGGHIAIHEYIAYEMWKMIPRSEDFEEFVAAVMASWRSHGGEPNIGLALPQWLEEMGMEIQSTRVMGDLTTRANPRWYWPVSFAVPAVDRLVHLGNISRETGDRLRARMRALHTETAWMVTPTVLEIIARKRSFN